MYPERSTRLKESGPVRGASLIEYYFRDAFFSKVPVGFDLPTDPSFIGSGTGKDEKKEGGK